MLNVILSQLAKDLMKYRNIFICSSVILITAFLTPGFADEQFPFLAEVSKESVNVRAGPSTNFEKIDKLSQGALVVVLGRSYEWLKVQPLATTSAFIRADYLGISPGKEYATVLGNNVNIRASAKSEATSLGQVQKGKLVKVLGQANGWCRIQPIAGMVAWIHQNFLRVKSWQVTKDMILQPISESAENLTLPVPSSAPVAPVKKSLTAVSPWVTMRGKVEALVQSPGQGVHYEIVMGDKSVFLLQDIPQLSFFCNTVVDLEGAVIPDPQKKLMYPLLHINKISLVL